MPPADPDRAERLKVALRANLKRRKQTAADDAPRAEPAEKPTAD